MSSYQTKIKLSNISKTFDNIKVLEKIDIDVQEGQIVSILGSSGCGKSTIFNIITRLIKADNGNLDINGDVSYMYQKDMMVPWKKVIDNIGIPLVLKGNSKREARSIVQKHINVFGLSGFEQKYPQQLSGGMKQRANFLKTYLTSDDIMLLDEPFGALDSITKRKMQLWLMELTKEMKSTILFITHDIEEAILLSDKIYIISEKPAIIKGTVMVNLLQNRNEDVIVSEEFYSIKKQILDIMKR